MTAVSGAARTRANAFVSVGLDRAGERRGDAGWIASLLASPDSRFLLVSGDGRLLANGEQPRVLDGSERRRLRSGASASLLGLADDGTAWFLLRAEDPTSPPAPNLAGHPWRGLRDLVPHLDAFMAGLCAYACALAQWQAGMRYCPSCASPLAWFEAGHRAECSNPACGRLQFPRTDPAIITIVEHDGACLLGRQARWPEGRFSTLAGFVEPGEALEDAVRREVHEEAGVRVLDCDYFASQPWPFPASLMLGFTATAAGRDITLRDGELREARWFTPADIVAGVADASLSLSPPVSVSWHLLDAWMQRRTGTSLRDLPHA